ncbi:MULTISPECIES: DUF433 domain-containing protein [Spirulina sp. CCY15215]|uniref:DUF433 domain-containing protein n=1 Tax=Spirulina sp. CCY15215 TaxID=2767591 RepID=UPI001EF1E9A5|nr:DUF433 domain-containing protein [Spirulina major]
MIDIYGGKDPRNIPSYSAGDAARYLKIPASTIRSWTVGRKYRVTEGKKRNKQFRPLIESKVTESKGKKYLLLTFINLVEIHVLRAIRQHQRINLEKVRKALDYINEELKIPHPLAHRKFYTDGVDLFVEYYSSLIDASQTRKTELTKTLNIQIQRIETDDSGLAIKLYPFTRKHEENNPRVVVIDPRIAFGKMTIAGTGIPTDIIIERFRAGDSHELLAYDYDCNIDKIKEVIRFENPLIAA